ncbi:translocon at the outer envelope membrane ofchloroplasts 34 [Striga asiatica]|uniref:Translocon at the outer envelope membrane ofchloroplasts 34 n=1 Tax=Striga asiatica TaxID=4170 RepID=A0A5A7PCR1_STRAF|nr:translocon at the outer envelope membrane ofchloroplasts 34 [Striga asiatica]
MNSRSPINVAALKHQIPVVVPSSPSSTSPRYGYPSVKKAPGHVPSLLQFSISVNFRALDLLYKQTLLKLQATDFVDMACQLIKEWTAIHQFPAATQEKLVDLLGKLKNENVNTLTILVMGKGGVGKSSTINSIIGERVVTVSAFQSETPRPVMVSRSRSDFTLNIIDTPGLVEGGYVSDQVLETIKSSLGRFLLNKTIDVLLYVDRLDAYRVDNMDMQIVKAITDSFGKEIWHKAVVVLTHAQLVPPDALSYEDFFSKRSDSLLKCIRLGARISRMELQNFALPVTLVENSGRCKKNDNDEKILPTGTPWIPNLVQTITDAVLNGKSGILVDKKLIEGPNANDRGKKFIPLILAAQASLLVSSIPVSRDRGEMSFHALDSVTLIHVRITGASIEFESWGTTKDHGSKNWEQSLTAQTEELPPNRGYSVRLEFLVSMAKTHIRWFFKYKNISHFIRPQIHNVSKLAQARFGASHFEDPEGCLTKLTQQGSVAEYQSEFESLTNLAKGIAEPVLISLFISGLKLTIRRDLQMNMPFTLDETFALARDFECKYLETQAASRTYSRGFSRGTSFLGGSSPSRMLVPDRRDGAIAPL